MNRWFVALGLILLTAVAAQAERVPSQKTEIPRDPGVRPVIAVPVTTNGYGNLGVYQGIAVAIYVTPVVDAPMTRERGPCTTCPSTGRRRRSAPAMGSSCAEIRRAALSSSEPRP